MTDDEILDAMDRYGGSFVRALADAFRCATVHDQATLKQAFAHHWEVYAIVAAADRVFQADRN